MVKDTWVVFKEKEKNNPIESNYKFTSSIQVIQAYIKYKKGMK